MGRLVAQVIARVLVPVRFACYWRVLGPIACVIAGSYVPVGVVDRHWMKRLRAIVLTSVLVPVGFACRWRAERLVARVIACRYVPVGFAHGRGMS